MTEQLQRPRIYEDEVLDSTKNEFEKFRLRCDTQRIQNKLLDEKLESLSLNPDWNALDEFQILWHETFKFYSPLAYSNSDLRFLTEGIKAREDKRGYYLGQIKVRKTQIQNVVDLAISTEEKRLLSKIDQAKENLEFALEQQRLTERQIAHDKLLMKQEEMKIAKEKAESLAADQLLHEEMLIRRQEQDKERREHENRKKSLVDKYLGKKDESK